MSENIPTITQLDDYRGRRPKNDPCIVSFVSFPFQDGTKMQVLSARFETTGDKVRDLVELMRQDGGVWFEDSSVSEAFVPWPCAAVLVRYTHAKRAIRGIPQKS